MNRKQHWETIYAARSPAEVGWYRPHLETSLGWIEALGLPADAPIIDVGGGASTLVDDLLNDGYRSITVLDLSRAALAAARARLQDRADLVTWLTADITTVELPADGYALWHDRAVFHFLTRAVEQRRYRRTLLHALRPGGHLIIGTFAPEAPPRCSGLPVVRYDRERLQERLGDGLELLAHRKELHTTPGGVAQMYLYCHFHRHSGA